MLAPNLYGVIDITGTGHRLTHKEYTDVWFQFNSYLIGPGVVYYPIPLVQLGASLGYSFVANQCSDSFIQAFLPTSNGGVAWSTSVAFDLGKNNHSYLLGIQYFGAYNNVSPDNVSPQTSSFIGVFVKYAFRNKRTQ